MPFHSAIVLNLRGNVLYSKYFLLDDVDRLNFERELFSRTFALWSKPLLPLKQTVAIQDKIVLFQRLGDIVLMVVGVEEVDEIILGEVMGTIVKILKDMFKSDFGESHFLEAENYGKWCAAMDDIAQVGGILDSLDPEQILRQVKMRT